MWKVVYNALLFVLLPLFVVVGLFNGKIRKTFLERLFPRLEGIDLDGVLWVHAASIGEAVIAETLVRYMATRHGLKKFLITTNTYYAKEMLQSRVGHGLGHVTSLPFDLICSIGRLLKNSTPSVLIIIETEIWPNLIWQSKRRGIPVIIVNGRISDKTIKNYRRFSFFLRHVLDHIDLVIAQSSEQAERFLSIGMDPSRVIATGNMKYYRDIPPFSDNQDKDNTATFGSIKEKEVQIVLDVIKRLKTDFPDLRFFIAPRELHLTEELESQFRCFATVARYSDYRTRKDNRAEVIVVDTVGDLLDIYKKSRVAFVGGSLAPYGGQNMLEPLFFATPVLFGPHVENFRDIADEILRQGAGMMVQNGNDLYEGMKTILLDEALRKQMGMRGRKITEKQMMVIENTSQMITGVIRRRQEEGKV